MRDVRDCLGEQHTDVVVVKGIDHVPALALADDEPEVAKHPKLLGDRGLFHPHGPCELADRARSRTQATQDSYPARRRQRLHRLGDHPSGIAVEICRTSFVAMAHVCIIA